MPAATPEVSYAGLAVEQAPSALGDALLAWTPRALRGGQLAAEWTGSGRYVMGYDVDAASRPTTPVYYRGYNVWNLHANCQVRPQVELFGRVMNLTNRNYAEVATYTANDRVLPCTYNPGNPRTVYAGVRIGVAR